MAMVHVVTIGAEKHHAWLLANAPAGAEVHAESAEAKLVP